MRGRKRANGTGGVTERGDGRWQARYSVRDEAGRLVRRHPYGRTRQEAEDNLLMALGDRLRGAVAARPGRSPTLRAHAKQWLAGRRCGSGPGPRRGPAPTWSRTSSPGWAGDRSSS